MKFKFLIFILFLFHLSSCSALEQPKNVINSQDIIGSWKLIHKSNDVNIFDSVERKNINISDIKITFQDNGKYALEITDKNKQAYMTSTTTWKISKNKKNTVEIQNLRYYPSDIQWAISNPPVTNFDFEFYKNQDSLGLCFPEPDISVCFEKI